jgi:Patatin-like phospholipase
MFPAFVSETANLTPLSAKELYRAERDAIEANNSGSKPTICLAISGGGIRSATFSLGVLQEFARAKLLSHVSYLSSVSGGGFIASFVHRLRHEYPKDWTTKLEASATANNGSAELLWLRRYSNYLTPRKSLFGMDAAGAVGGFLRNVFLIQLQLVSFLFFSVTLAYMGFLALAYLSGLEGTHRVPFTLGAASLGLFLFNSFHRRISSGHLRPSENSVQQSSDDAQLMLMWLMFGLTAVLTSIGAVKLADSGQRANWTLVAVMVVTLYVSADFASWVIGKWERKTEEQDRSLKQSFLVALFGALGALFAATVLFSFYVIVASVTQHRLLFAAILGPPMVMSCMLSAGAIQLGMMSVLRTSNGESNARFLRYGHLDVLREFWARVGGTLVLFFIVLWPLLAGLIWLSPTLVEAAGDWNWFALASWTCGSLAGVLLGNSSATTGINPDQKRRHPLLEKLVIFAPALFILGLVVLLSWCVFKALGLTDILQVLPSAAGNLGRWLLVALIPLLVWALLALTVDINEFGLSKIYQLRLTRCYQGAARAAVRMPEPRTNFDPDDDLLLSKLRKYGAPYPLICAALNRVDKEQTETQDRRASSFVFSPLYCGSLPLSVHQRAVGDCQIGTQSALAQQVSLGQAIAISGAAANPNMGYHSSSAITFLLTVFNLRLGWWLPNFVAGGSERTRFFGRYLLHEMLGNVTADSKLVNLSDGGHFENLALYELIRRQQQLIVCIDAGADAEDPERYRYSDLAGLVRKARIDLGVAIEFKFLPQKDDGEGYAIGRISYRDTKTEGWIILLKPCLLADKLPVDVLNYARAHPEFPQQSTGDQYFDEAQFESYRKLGQGVAEKVSKILRSQLAQQQAQSNDKNEASGILAALFNDRAPDPTQTGIL